MSTGRLLLTMLVLITFTLPIQAQDVVIGERKQTTIEIKDGKVYLNGEEVAELDDPESSVFFKQDGVKMKGNMRWMSDNDEFEGLSGNAFIFKDDGSNEFVVEGKPNVYGFLKRRSGENVEFFDDEDFERVFELSSRAEVTAAENVVRGLERGMARFEVASPFVVAGERSWNSETMELERQSRDVARQIRQNDGNDSELESELNAILAKIFDAKLEAQQARVDKLREQLTEMEESLGLRQDDRSEIIEKRRNELLGRGSRYEW